MGKLHLGSITELADRICRYNEIIDNLKLSNEELSDRLVFIESEWFIKVTEDEFDALSDEDKAANNYAIIEE